MILTGQVRELRLKEQLLAAYYPIAIETSEGFAHSCFEVVASLVGRIDGTEATPNSELDQSLGPVFFPCSAVNEGGSAGGRGGWHSGILPCAIKGPVSGKSGPSGVQHPAALGAAAGCRICAIRRVRSLAKRYRPCTKNVDSLWVDLLRRED